LNNWDRPTIDRNMKQLPNSSAFEADSFDKDSIMKYEFPAWQFRNGTGSKCFSRRNDTLSTADRSGIARAYPRELVLIRDALEQQVAAVSAVSAAADMVQVDRDALREMLKSLSAEVARR
jgi:hypothetical protein